MSGFVPLAGVAGQNVMKHLYARVKGKNVGNVNYPSRFADEIKVSFTKVKVSSTENIHIDVTDAYGVSEYAMLAKSMSEENNNVTIYMWHKNWSFTYNGAKQ